MSAEKMLTLLMIRPTEVQWLAISAYSMAHLKNVKSAEIGLTLSTSLTDITLRLLNYLKEFSSTNDLP